MTTLPPPWDRVQAERDELRGRVLKLQAFLGAPGAALVSEAHLGLLRRQLHWMLGYLGVLSTRLAVAAGQAADGVAPQGGEAETPTSPEAGGGGVS